MKYLSPAVTGELSFKGMNVLVIEDDKRIAGLVERGLRENGHRVSVSYNGREGAEMMLRGSFDLALLDVLLPGMNGMEVLEYVRSKRCETVVLVLTAIDAVPKILRAFDLGADDYLVKPFILEILLARISAVSRRLQNTQTSVIHAGDMRLNRDRRTVARGGKELYLTRKQFNLLEVLMRRNGLVTPREHLIEAGWGHLAAVRDNTLDVYIHGLRSKLETEFEANSLIRTIHGTGYMFAIE
jgi:two-component system, OmpR family, response regulator